MWGWYFWFKVFNISRCLPSPWRWAVLTWSRAQRGASLMLVHWLRTTWPRKDGSCPDAPAHPWRTSGGWGRRCRSCVYTCTTHPQVTPGQRSTRSVFIKLTTSKHLSRPILHITGWGRVNSSEFSSFGSLPHAHTQQRRQKRKLIQLELNIRNHSLNQRESNGYVSGSNIRTGTTVALEWWPVMP